MNLVWEDIAPLICGSCKGTCDAANHGPDSEMSPDRFAEQHGCESHEVYDAAERVAAYVNDLADLQEEGWKRAQALLADHRRKSPDFQKLKAWWSDDKNWFRILSDDGINQTTISLTVEEASLLSMSAEPPIEKIPSAEMRAERLARDVRRPPQEQCAMTDIVQRLRAPTYVNEHYDAGKENFDPLRLEAANEIDRLRAALRYIIDEGDHVSRWVLGDKAREALALPPAMRGSE